MHEIGPPKLKLKVKTFVGDANAKEKPREKVDREKIVPEIDYLEDERR